ncbi:condensation domain-containing protein, partial [Legionella oakridgensis]|uniref:condensation domain-containing protein n=1 Tax=Legionella oakridgensis TaxID=29423 RepID=UPI00055DF225
DRQALPKPNFNSNSQTFIAPRTTLEQTLCQAFQEVLRLSYVSVTDDFFRLGGDSIQSIEVAARLQRMGIPCQVRDLFTYRSIEALAKALGQTKIHAEQGLLSGSFPLSPIQTWFFEQNLPKAAHWNQAFLIRVPPLSIERLEQILPKLIQHHDALRLNFQKTQAGWQQSYQALPLSMKIKTLKVTALCHQEILHQFTDWQAHFNLKQAPLWQIAYLEGYPDGSARLYLALHHLIVDTVSWRLLIDDLKALYQGQDLGSKTSSYRQWVQALETYPKNHPEELRYWQNLTLQNNQALNAFKLDSQAYQASCRLDKTTTQALLNPVHEAYHTQMNDVLLTALAYALKEVLNENENLITLEGHGRELIDDTIDVSRTLGWFTSQFPVKLCVQDSISETLQEIKESLHHTPNKGVGYATFKTCHPDALPEQPPIVFNYLGQFDKTSRDWQLANENAGQTNHPQNQQPLFLSMNGKILGGQLHFHLLSHHTQKTVNQMAQAFKNHLKTIIAHCLTQKSRYTPCDFHPLTLSRTYLNRLQERHPSIEAIYSANSLQQGFIYHALAYPQDDAYRIQTILDYHHPLNLKAYQKAWEAIIETYPILRTAFDWEEIPIQIISKEAKLDFRFHDISNAKNKDLAIRAIQEQDRQCPFDLQKPGLLRIHLIKQGQSLYTLLKSSHHSILDGWSNPILLRQLHLYYHAFLKGERLNLSIDKAYLNTQAYIAKHKQNALKAWQTRLQETLVANDLNPMLSQTVLLDTVRSVKVPQKTSLYIKDKVYQDLKTLSREQGFTLAELVQFAWHKLIQGYTQDEHTIVGTTVSGRALPITDIENSVGLYINTLPLILDWTTKPLRTQLKLIQERLRELQEQAYVDLVALQREGKRLFHSLLIFENYPKQSITEDQSLKLSFRDSIEKLDYPLALLAFENEVGLSLILKYDETFLTKEKAYTLLKQLNHILRQLKGKLDKPHQTIDLLTPKEYQTLIYDWNQTDKDYPKDKT